MQADLHEKKFALVHIRIPTWRTRSLQNLKIQVKTNWKLPKSERGLEKNIEGLSFKLAGAKCCLEKVLK